MRSLLRQRPWTLLRDILARRERPDLHRLEAIADPEEFVWAILPHAARTFSACIALLPSRLAMPAAVGYLYCRILDTYEDLTPDADVRDSLLAGFAARFDTAGTPAPVEPVRQSLDRDERDRAHLLLVRRVGLVDEMFVRLDPDTRAVIRDLVRDMAEGMRWSSRAFRDGGGVLSGEANLSRYCRAVLGNPVVFSARLLRLRYGSSPRMRPDELEQAMLVGEMVQLANITRDIEKDLARGVAYDATLRHDLGRDASSDRALAERCRCVRERLLRLALERVESYQRLIASIELPRWSGARAAAVLMLLFTERYFRSCARRAGLEAWKGPESIVSILFRVMPTAFSRERAFREIRRVENAFLQASRRYAAGSLDLVPA